MATVGLTDDANEALRNYCDHHELDPSMRKVASAAVLKYVEENR